MESQTKSSSSSKKESINEKKRIFFLTMDAIGHQNACIGLALMLTRFFEIYFIIKPNQSNRFKKYPEINEIIIKSSEDLGMKIENPKSHPLSDNHVLLEQLKIKALNNKSSYEKLLNFTPEKQESLFMKACNEIKSTHSQLEMIIEEKKPSLIIVDLFVVPPCIAYGKIPWILLFSGAPTYILNSPDIPPPASGNFDSPWLCIYPLILGYPSYDRTNWDKFRERQRETSQKSHRFYQNLINKHFGFPEVDNNHFMFISPYLNIYGYPKELDFSDMITIPENFLRIDAFCHEKKSFKRNERFRFPEFRSKLQIDDKLIYLSLGSMASIDVDLMRRLVNELSRSRHKFIVSKGPCHDQYQLAENMWGEPFLPQMKILPFVDLVITHGGNNTVTETMTFGKPMIVMPLFADQYDNAQRITEKGFGARIDTYGFEDGELVQLIDKILNNNEILERCKKAAERISQSSPVEIVYKRIQNLISEELLI